MVNLSVLWVNDEAADSIPFHFLFLPLERTACQLKCSRSKGKSFYTVNQLHEMLKLHFMYYSWKGHN